MKTAMIGLAVLLGAASYLVPARSSAYTITCWYNADGKYTGSNTGTGMPVGQKPVKYKGKGDYAWGYTIEATAESECPRRI